MICLPGLRMNAFPGGIWLHPWDLVDEGAETVLGRVSDMGLDYVGLATSYHQGRYLLPHNPRRRMYLAEEGVVYFQPHPELYKDTLLKPRRSSNVPTDALALLLKHAPNYGIKVKSWTVCLHNHEFVRQFPEMALEDMNGDRDPNFLCPNNPNSRNYVLALTRDLASNYDLEAVTLESFGYPWGFEHFDHHETFGTYVEPLFQYLLTTCFCNYCKKRASEENLDLERLRKTAKGIVDLSLSMPPSIQPRVPLEYQYKNLYDLTNDYDEIRALLSFKQTTAAQTLQAAKDVLRDSGSDAKLGVTPLIMYRGPEGINLRGVSKIIDEADVATYFSEVEPVEYFTRWLKHETEGNCELNIILRTSYPFAFSLSTIRDQILSVKRGGANGVAFYNYGWTALENFGAIKSGLEAARKG